MGALNFFKSGRYIEYFDTTCKRSQTDPGLPDFGSRSVYKNEIGLWQIYFIIISVFNITTFL